MPGGLDASAYAPVVFAAAAISSSRRPAVAGCAAGAPPPHPDAPAPMLIDAGEAETEYERQRAERIRRNTEMLNALRVPEAAASTARAAAAAAGTAAEGRPLPRPPRAALPRVRGSFQPTRASARARGLEPGAAIAEAALGERSSGGGARGGGARGAAAAANGGVLLPRPDLMTIEEYWRQRGGNPCSDPLISDGCYRG